MPISSAIQDQLERSSWIRRMFEQGHRLKQEVGADAVYDFSLGNPDLDPPPEFCQRLRELVENPPPGVHRYMPNAGWPSVRAKIAESLARRTGLEYAAEHVVMTVGAGGGLNVALKSLLNPGDEVVVISPYFVEYLFYTANHGGETVIAESRADFGLPEAELSQVLTPRTRAVLINSPNNPTGRVYSTPELEEFSARLTEAAERFGAPIYLITDEPYRGIVYPGFDCPEVAPLYRDTLLVTSHSKDLGLAGERIGYLAVSPRAEDAKTVVEACTFSNRTLGFVNAPSLFQLAVADCQDLTVDVSTYLERRDLLLRHLRTLGFEVETPGGAFYLFPRSPIPDDTEFVRDLLQFRILVVPGTGFGRPGYFRISFAVPTDVIRRSLPIWEQVAKKYPQLSA